VPHVFFIKTGRDALLKLISVGLTHMFVQSYSDHIVDRWVGYVSAHKPKMGTS